jgi:1-acyl-sn-glycerol-3-phosphate acyltransferase
VLAIAAEAPVTPLVVYGTREVQRKGSFVIRSATVHVHFLEEIPTAGMHYDDRDRLADECWRRMAAALEREHGVVSSKTASRRERTRRAERPSFAES